MNSLNALADQVGGLPTQAVGALTHGFRTSETRVRHMKSPAVPAERRVGDPASFAARRRNPDSGLASTVDDCQRPLGFEVNHVSVRNMFSPEWIHNFDLVGPEDQFRAHPDEVGGCSKQNAQHHFVNGLQCAGGHVETVDGEEKDESKRHSRKHEVALRSKNIFHSSSIAGCP